MSDLQILAFAGFMFVGLPTIVFVLAFIVSWLESIQTKRNQ